MLKVKERKTDPEEDSKVEDQELDPLEMELKAEDSVEDPEDLEEEEEKDRKNNHSEKPKLQKSNKNECKMLWILFDFVF